MVVMVMPVCVRATMLPARAEDGAADSDDEQPRNEVEPRVEVVRDDEAREQKRHEPEGEDADRVRGRNDQTEQRGVTRRAALTHEIRSDDRLTVAGRERMRHAPEERGAERSDDDPEAQLLAVDQRREPGVGGAVGHVLEYGGDPIRGLSMEGRMTICNMSIEAGARAGMIAPDDTTFAYLEGRPAAPKGAEWERALDRWRALGSDDDAVFDREVAIDVSELEPQVTWGTNPGMVAPIGAAVPDPADYDDPDERAAIERALAYMGLEPGTPLRDVRIDRVFIGSCTNARIEDLREAAAVVAGRRVSTSVRAMVVPGSATVKRMAEEEGLDRVFEAAGFEWRRAGCSMCLGMNPDILQPGERCASTSNRNFEGRQGRGGRTHLVSPAMAAATALAGHFVDVRELALEPVA